MTVDFKAFHDFCLNENKFVFTKSANNQDSVYTPPYIEFMLEASEKLQLSGTKKISKDDILHWLTQNWPTHFGKPSDRKLEYMATFLRRPENEKGGYIKSNADDSGNQGQ